MNDVLIDPRNPERVLIATDRGGVLASNDGFAKYQSSNRGFSHRMVGSVIADRKDQNRLYVGIVNDKVHGGMFTTDDVGKTWLQVSKGLGDRDILSLQQAENGVMFAGTNHGIFFLTSLVGAWQPASDDPWTGAGVAAEAGTRCRAAAPEATKVEEGAKPLRPGSRQPVREEEGAGRGADSHRNCTACALDCRSPTRPGMRRRTKDCSSASMAARSGMELRWMAKSDFVAANDYPDGTMTLATIKRAFLSRDGGRTWYDVTIPKYVTGIYNFTMTPDSSLWLATREGATTVRRWRQDLGPCAERLADQARAGGQVRSKLQTLAGDCHGLARSLRKRGRRQDLEQGPGVHVLHSDSHGIPGPDPGDFVA